MFSAILNFLKSLWQDYKTIFTLYNVMDTPTEATPIETLTPKEKMLVAANRFIGMDASPEDNVPDEVGCVESIVNIIKDVYPDFPTIYHTMLLYYELVKNPNFKSTLEIKPGHLIVSPTGSGNGTVRGHCGVVAEDNKIISSNSTTGKWESNYTLNGWIDSFRVKGGLRIYVFEPI